MSNLRSSASRRNPPAYRRRAWCGIAAPVLIATTTSVSTVRAANHSLISDTVSDLAAQDVPNTLLLRAGLVGFGLLVITFAAEVGAIVQLHARLVQIGLSAFGASVALAGVFQDYSERPGVPHNREGFLHNTFGLLAIAGLLCSIAAMARVVRVDRRWQGLALINMIVSIVVVVTGAGFLRGPTRIQGLDELVLYGAALVWLLSVARLLITIEPAGQVAPQDQSSPARVAPDVD